MMKKLLLFVIGSLVISCSDDNSSNPLEDVNEKSTWKIIYEQEGDKEGFNQMLSLGGKWKGATDGQILYDSQNADMPNVIEHESIDDENVTFLYNGTQKPSSEGTELNVEIKFYKGDELYNSWDINLDDENSIRTISYTSLQDE